MKSKLTLATTVALCAIVTACTSNESEQPAGESIECAIGEGKDFERVCTYQYDEAKREAVIYHPDGGFRRFRMLPGGAGVASTDGAEDVMQGIMGGQLEVTVGYDRYRFPTMPAQ